MSSNQIGWIVKAACRPRNVGRVAAMGAAPAGFTGWLAQNSLGALMGVGAAVVLPAIAEPALKAVLKAGMAVPMIVNQAWEEAKQERQAADPAALRTEIAQIRAEIEDVQRQAAQLTA
jgi:hypothetical protein